MIKISEDQLVRILTSKGCKIRDKVISLKAANDLGNRCWGYLDLLRKIGYSVIDKIDYIKSCKSKYGTAEAAPTKKKKEKKDDEMADMRSATVRDQRYHCYDGIPEISENGTRSTEYAHLVMLNERMTITSHDIALYKVNKAVRRDRVALKRVSTFFNYKIRLEELNHS